MAGDLPPDVALRSSGPMRASRVKTTHASVWTITGPQPPSLVQPIAGARFLIDPG